MPNIAITGYCNLRCPYCFADDMIQEKHENISLEKYREILKWIARIPSMHIGIIGGEPTLHPQFKEILEETNKFCLEQRSGYTLFTNGIHLDEYVQYIGEKAGVLINVNSPDNMSPDKWAKINQAIDHIYCLGWFEEPRHKANIGCNLYIERDNYDFIWDLVDRYNLKHIRMSITAPGGKYKNLITDKHKYYAQMKPTLMKFVDEAIQHDCKLGCDCNQIPDCYFTEEEHKKLSQVLVGKRNGICEPVVDITSDFKATACFGSYDPVDCSQFATFEDLRRYLLYRKSFPRYELNTQGRCATCKNHELMTCQGGCLGFAKLGE